MPLDEPRRTNRDMWDESVPIHVASDGYAVKEFLQGQTVLHDRDIEEMGDVSGQTLLHLQCHFGLDTLSWARLGATVTGLDYSQPAIDAARDLATQADINDATFVLSELYDAPQALPDQSFDIVYTGIGALCWLPDIKRWAEIVAGFLKPRGRLYLIEGHPALWASDDTRTDTDLVLFAPYFETREPNRWEDGTDYADPTAVMQNTVTYNWNHGLGEIVSALIDAGLSLDWLHEHKTAYWKAMTSMVSVQDANHWQVKDEWQLPQGQRDHLPLMYSLTATKPARP